MIREFISEIDIVSAVNVPFGAIVVFGVMVVPVFTQDASENISDQVAKFHGVRSITPALLVRVASLARVNVKSPNPSVGFWAYTTSSLIPSGINTQDASS
jgi:hypothetical protein